MKSQYTTTAMQPQMNPRHSNEKSTATETINDVEEKQALPIVRELLKFRIRPDRLTFGHTKMYTAVRLDEKNHRPVCRLYLNRPKRYIGVLNKRKVETRHLLDDLTDIAKYAKEMLGTVDAYDK